MTSALVRCVKEHNVRVPILAVAVNLALAATGAQAEPSARGSAEGEPGAASAGERPSEAALGLARALLSEEQWNQILDTYASNVSEQVSKALVTNGEPIPDGLEETIRTELGKELRYEEVIDAQARALVKQLAPDELRKAAAFYSSPVGTKVLTRLPLAQEEVGQQLQTRLSTALPQIVQRVAPKALARPDASGEQGSPERRSPPPQAREPPAKDRPRR